MIQVGFDLVIIPGKTMLMDTLIGLLAGEWNGSGNGEYPTIESFQYKERLLFTPDETRPLVHYQQRTHRRPAGQEDYVPSHWETGFIELLPDGRVQLANAQSGGRVEVLFGSIEPAPDGLILRLRSAHFANDPRMQESERTLTVKGDTLHYTMLMQTTAVPRLVLHLEATLQRRAPGQG